MLAAWSAFTTHWAYLVHEQFASQLLEIVPPGNQADVKQLISDIHIWRDRVLEFATEADLKLRTSHIGNNAFLPEPDYSPSGSSAELLVRKAQYRLAVTQAQLSASREASRAASEKLMEVTGQLGNILAQIASLDVQKQNVSPLGVLGIYSYVCTC